MPFIIEKFEEEALELIEAYRKKDYENLKEELVDVMIMCEQLKIYYGISDEYIAAQRQFKINRTLDRMKEGIE